MSNLGAGGGSYLTPEFSAFHVKASLPLRLAKKQKPMLSFFKIFIYLFIWLRRVLVEACDLSVAARMWDLVP